MTLNKEDYLKEICKLGSMEEQVSNKQIAESPQIVSVSVTETLGKLKREDLTHYEPYKSPRLTDAGMRIAITPVRGHRLWEAFLMRHPGYSWSGAHEDVELSEHITLSRLTARLDQFLNYLAYCPHGSAIPHPDGQVDLTPLQPFSPFLAGQISHIRRVTEEKELPDYLQASGITIGSAVRIVEAGVHEGPLTLDLEGGQVQISCKAACHICVDEAAWL